MKKLLKTCRDFKYKLRGKKYKIPPYSYSFLCEELLKINNIEAMCFMKHNKNSKHRKRRVIIRHDVDLDPWTSLKMAKIEHRYGLVATYFILHSAKYYKSKFEETLEIFKKIQSLGHEIGLHNDLLTDYFKYGYKPNENLHNILTSLRNNGIKIYGSAAHGSKIIQNLNKELPKEIYYTNYLIFDEIYKKNMSSNPAFSKLPNPKYNNLSLNLPFLSMKEFNLSYETYFVEMDYYISDTRRKFWFIGNDPIKTIKSSKLGETTQLLFHPVWWKLDLE
jgi:hypothetical protein